MIKHNIHPDEEMLMAYWQGNLPFHHSIVIEAHLEMCEDCRAQMQLFDNIGASFMMKEDEISMNDDALALALARIERPVEEKPKAIPDYLQGFELPQSILRHDFQNRYWAAPGVWIAKIETPKNCAGMAYLMYAQKGLEMPNHSHNGKEMTLVLQGSLSDCNGKAQIGEMLFADEGFDHSPQIGDDIDCLCLIAADTYIHPTTLLGKILQPFARI